MNTDILFKPQLTELLLKRIAQPDEMQLILAVLNKNRIVDICYRRKDNGVRISRIDSNTCSAEPRHGYLHAYDEYTSNWVSIAPTRITDIMIIEERN